MNSTDTTPAPAAGGRQVGQLLAGRYRLAMYKGGDDIADVWHALDQTTEKVVTLEILRDRDDDAARQRFLAEAQRMAAIERPSVMRVAAIHNEATETFIVFEHLIPLPVVLTGLTAVAKDVRPATQAAEDRQKTAAVASPAPQAPVAVAPATLAAVVGPKRSASPALAEEAAASTIVELDETSRAAAPSIAAPAPLPERLQAAARSLRSQSDVSLIVTTATEIVADAREWLRAHRPDRLVASARALVPQRLETTALESLVTRASTRMRRTTKSTTKLRVPPDNEPRSSTGAAMSAGASALSAVAAVGMSLAANAVPLLARAGTAAAPLIGRARGNPVVRAAATAALLLAVFVVSPLDDMLASSFRSGALPVPTVAPTAVLRPAQFQVPPLAAYGAAFDTQGAYPKAAPNGMVEWVVALRNTGSAGWYRGIEGAQAALALPDGTGVAVQSTEYVAPGQVGWFVVRFKARAEVGTYTVQLLPRIDGHGPLPDLGIHAVVTVSTNP